MRPSSALLERAMTGKIFCAGGSLSAAIRPAAAGSDDGGGGRGDRQVADGLSWLSLDLWGPFREIIRVNSERGLASKIGFPYGFQRATARSMNDLTPIEIAEIAAFTAVALLLVVTFVLLLKTH